MIKILRSAPANRTMAPFYFSFVLIVVMSLMATSPAIAEEVTTDGSRSGVTFSLGAKIFDEDDWYPVENHVVIAAEYDYAGAGWPISLVVGFSTGGSGSDWGDDNSWGYYDNNHYYDDGTWTISAELYGGIRKYFREDQFVSPFIGAGVALVVMEMTEENYNNTVDDTETLVAGYVEAGMLFRVNNFQFGFGVKPVFGGEFELLGRSGDYLYFQQSILFRMSF